MLPKEIKTKLNEQREKRRHHMARIYAISAKYAPDIEPTEMFPVSDQWQSVRDIPGAQSRCIHRDEISTIHLVKISQAGVLREHTHKRAGQYVQVLTGLLRARKDSTVRVLRRGDWMWIDAGVPHRMSWGDDTEVLVTFSKATRLEAF